MNPYERSAWAKRDQDDETEPLLNPAQWKAAYWGGGLFALFLLCPVTSVPTVRTKAIKMQGQERKQTSLTYVTTPYPFFLSFGSPKHNAELNQTVPAPQFQIILTLFALTAVAGVTAYFIYRLRDPEEEEDPRAKRRR